MDRFLSDSLPGYLRVLSDMIAINSHTMNAAGVNRLCDYTRAVFEKRGFTGRKISSVYKGCGNHLLLSRAGTSPEKIGCVSHLDTVFTAEEEVRNGFVFRIAGDRIYGPGANDIKGGTAVMLMMIDALRRFAPDAFERFSWELLFDATEETESDDFGAIAREALGTTGRACLVFESGEHAENEFILTAARKGRAVMRVTTSGKSAHAGSDHARGASAILQMADLLPKLEALTDYAAGLTCTVGTVEGGTALNRVPDSCDAGMEIRAFDPAVLSGAVEKALSYNGYSTVGSADGSFRCVARVELLRTNPSWPMNPGTGSLVAAWSRAAAVMGKGILAAPRGGISDGNLLWDTLPVIDGLGPAGDNCHCAESTADGLKEQEYALMSSFVPKAVLSALALCELARKDDGTDGGMHDAG